MNEGSNQHPAQPVPSKRGKTLILCFDGTLDRYRARVSNIARLVSFLDKSDPSKQLVYYQDGIGTNIGSVYYGKYVQFVLNTWDSAVAWSLDEHVMDGYRFLQNHWEEGDRICLFGFSRGAYTARALDGMLYHVGLLPRGMTSEIRFAYSIYKRQQDSAQYKHDFSRVVTVDFIGVFDTVTSVGTMLPRTLPLTTSNHMVKTFRHALSLDEHRASFQAKPWVRSTPGEHTTHSGVEADNARGLFREAKDAEKRVLDGVNVNGPQKKTPKALEDPSGSTTDFPQAVPAFKGTDVKEVWFAGCHTDIGGGSTAPNNSSALENITLRWMLKEILLAQPGIIFRPDEPRLVELGIYVDPSPSPAPQPEATTGPDGVNININGTTASPESTSGTSIEADDNPSSRPLNTRHSQSQVDNPRSTVEPASVASPYMPIDARPEDVRCPITDKAKNPLWWFLEFIPMVIAHQDGKDRWHNSLRLNLWRPRRIPPSPLPSSPNAEINPDPEGANIGAAAPPGAVLFHVSVKMRQEMDPSEFKRKDGGLSKLGLGLGVLGGGKKRYTPRARLMKETERDGQIVYVR